MVECPHNSLSYPWCSHPPPSLGSGSRAACQFSSSATNALATPILKQLRARLDQGLDSGQPLTIRAITWLSTSGFVEIGVSYKGKVGEQMVWCVIQSNREVLGNRTSKLLKSHLWVFIRFSALAAHPKVPPIPCYRWKLLSITLPSLLLNCCVYCRVVVAGDGI